MVRIGEADLRRALAWALQIPPQQLGLIENLVPVVAVLLFLILLSIVGFAKLNVVQSPPAQAADASDREALVSYRKTDWSVVEG